MPDSEISLLTAGIIFGLSGGLTPGPLFTFIISETLKYGSKEGVKIAFVPLLSDLPIVLTSLFIVSKLSEINFVIGMISLAGAIYLIFLAMEGLKFNGTLMNTTEVSPQSIRKGITINFLNPNPYIFWMTVGAPTVINSSKVSFMGPVVFIGGMYIFLVGSKLVLAILVGKSKIFLKSKIYIYTIRFLGVLLLLFAVIFIYRAWISFGF